MEVYSTSCNALAEALVLVVLGDSVFRDLHEVRSIRMGVGTMVVNAVCSRLNHFGQFFNSMQAKVHIHDTKIA